VIRLRYRRLYVCRRRCHHGLIGTVFAIAGLLLVAHDWADRPWWPTHELLDR
jgi:hypothetical protein